MGIGIKDHKILVNLMKHLYHRKLVALSIWCSARYSVFMITSAYRENDKGVHGTTPCRALDIRSTWYPAPEKVVADINEHWTYDASRPALQCALLHDTGNGIHIHLQVSDRTIFHEKGRGDRPMGIAGVDDIPTAGGS